MGFRENAAMTDPYEGWTMQEKLRELQRLRAEHRAIAPERESVAVPCGPLVSPVPLSTRSQMAYLRQAAGMMPVR